jgi:hypothetical protein
LHRSNPGQAALPELLPEAPGVRDMQMQSSTIAFRALVVRCARLDAKDPVPALTRNAAEEDSPAFSIYSGQGGLPQDPCCGGESSPRTQELPEVGCQVRDLFRPGI